MLALAILVLAVASFAIAASLHLTWTGTIVAAFVLGMTEIVVLVELLSVFHAIHAWSLLAGETAIALGGLAWWLQRGRPRPSARPIQWSAFRRHRLIIVLGIAVAAALGAELALAVVAAPNNWDSMTYHLSRAAAWYQSHAVDHVDAHTARQNAFPPNAEILALYTMVFAHSDRFVALPQFVSELALLVAIFGVARRLGFRRSEAAFAALLFATLSQVVLQSTTTQNDLIVTACVVASAYFLLGGRRSDLLLAGLAFGLAAGTKPTAALAAPILFVLAAVVLRRKQLATFAAAVAVAFVVVASPVYAANIRDYGNLLGPPSTHAAYQAKLTPGAVTATFGKIVYRFVDLSGVQYRSQVSQAPPPGSAYAPVDFRARTVPKAKHDSALLLNGRANEDGSYFGPLGFLLVIPLAVGYMVASVRSRADRVKGVLAIALPLYIAELALTYSANPFIGRFMLVPVGLAAPLLARSYSIDGLRTIAVGVGVLFLALALVRNEHKPIGLGDPPVWAMTRPDTQALGRPEMATALRTIDNLVPQQSTVGYVLGEDAWDYPLYGGQLERRLIRLPATEPLDSAARLGIHWVVIDNVSTSGSRDWVGIRFRGSGWSLLAPRDSREATRLLDLASTGSSAEPISRRSGT